MSRTVELGDFTLFSTEPVTIVTVTDQVPLALAVAYLFPPHGMAFKLRADHHVGFSRDDLKEGWGPVTNVSHAADRIAEAVDQIGQIDRLAAAGETSLQMVPHIRHRKLFTVDGDEIRVGEAIFRGLPEHWAKLRAHASIRREGDVVLLVTRYTAQSVHR